jgi:hypothetical protein
MSLREGQMSEYRLFHIEQGRIAKAQIVSADSTPAAIEKAREKAGDQPAELWFETE